MSMFDYEKGIRTGKYMYGIFYHPTLFAMYKLSLPSKYPIRIARIEDDKPLTYEEIIDKLPPDKKAQVESYTSGDIYIEVSYVIINSMTSGEELLHDIATNGGRNPIIKS